MLDLTAPLGIVIVYPRRSDDQKVYVTSHIPITASCASEKRCVNGSYPPSSDCLTEPANQLHAGTSHLLDSSSEQVVVIQCVEKCASRIHPLNETLINQAIENVLHAGSRTSGPPCQLTTGSRRGGACQGNQDIGIDPTGQSCERFRHVHRDLIIDHTAYN